MSNDATMVHREHSHPISSASSSSSLSSNASSSVTSHSRDGQDEDTFPMIHVHYQKGVGSHQDYNEDNDAQNPAFLPPMKLGSHRHFAKANETSWTKSGSIHSTSDSKLRMEFVLFLKVLLHFLEKDESLGLKQQVQDFLKDTFKNCSSWQCITTQIKEPLKNLVGDRVWLCAYHYTKLYQQRKRLRQQEQQQKKQPRPILASSSFLLSEDDYEGPTDDMEVVSLSSYGEGEYDEDGTIVWEEDEHDPGKQDTKPLPRLPVLCSVNATKTITHRPLTRPRCFNPAEFSSSHPPRDKVKTITLISPSEIYQEYMEFQEDNLVEDPEEIAVILRRTSWVG